MKNLMAFAIQRAHLRLQELGPEMGLLLLPGGYVIALAGWLHRRLPRRGVRS